MYYFSPDAFPPGFAKEATEDLTKVYEFLCMQNLPAGSIMNKMFNPYLTLTRPFLLEEYDADEFFDQKWRDTFPELIGMLDSELEVVAATKDLEQQLRELKGYKDPGTLTLSTYYYVNKRTL